MAQNFTIPKIRNILQLGIFLMVVKVSFSLSSILAYSNLADNILSFSSAACFALCILYKKYSVKALVVYVLIGGLALYSSLKINNYEVLITVLTCLAIRDKDIDEICVFLYKYEMLFLSLHTAYSIVRHFLLNESLVLVVSGISRYHFGMGHPNRFSMYLFNLMLLWMYLNFKRLNNKNVFGFLLIGVSSYVFTQTRTNLMEIIIIAGLLLIWINVPTKTRVENILKKISMYIVPVLAGFTMLCVYLYSSGNDIVKAVDLFLSSRIRLGAYAFHKYGLTILGQPVSYDIKYDTFWRLNTFTFDNTYTFLCISQGIIWLVIISVLFYKLAKYGTARICFTIIAWALYGITEVHGLNVCMCFPVMLIALLFDTQSYICEESMESGEG